MDINYHDFSQYIRSHKHYVWKNVIFQSLEKSESNSNYFEFSELRKVFHAMIYDYGVNGLGYVDMQIYNEQIKSYAGQFMQLFNKEFVPNIMKHANIYAPRHAINDEVTKQQLFQFISIVPQFL